MNNTDLKFFTNEPERDLYSRFAAILKSNTQFFDVLVGYFRASGFFKMYEALESIEKIRILVGLNVDRFTVKIIDRATNEAKVAAISAADGKEIIAGEVERSLSRQPVLPRWKRVCEFSSTGLNPASSKCVCLRMPLFMQKCISCVKTR